MSLFFCFQLSMFLDFFVSTLICFRLSVNNPSCKERRTVGGEGLQTDALSRVSRMDQCIVSKIDGYVTDSFVRAGEEKDVTG